MRTDHIAYQRATQVAVIGLALQFLFTLTVLIFGLMVPSQIETASGDTTFVFAGLYALTGILVWLSLSIVFNQHKLERLEALESDELQAQRGAGLGSAFEDESGEFNVAGRRLALMHKWLMPFVSWIIILTLAGLGTGMLYGLRQISDPTYSGEQQFLIVGDSYRGWALAICLLIAASSFICSRFVAGMAKQPAWQNLRAGAGYMVGNALVMFAIAVGIVFTYFDNEVVIGWIARSILYFMIVFAGEILLNFILNLYRPRRVGEVPRPAFDSKLLSMLSAPDSIVRSINEAINYQFGFDITSSWGYQLLIRATRKLVLFAIIILILLSCFVIVEPHQQAVRLRGGEIVNVEPHGSGVMLKFPWPFEQAEVYDVTRIRTLPLTKQLKEFASQRNIPVVWSQKIDDNLGIEPFIVSATPVSFDDAYGIQQELNADNADGDSGTSTRVDLDVSFALIESEFVLHYRIRNGGLMDYLNLSSDTIARRQPYQMRERYLRAIALREITRHVMGLDLNEIISSGRATMVADLRDRVQLAFDLHKTGVEVVDISNPWIRPAGEAAAQYETLSFNLANAAKQLAEAEQTKTRSQTAAAGSPEKAREIITLIDEYDRRENANASVEELAALEKQIETHVLRAGGFAAATIANARSDFWLKILGAEARLEQFKGRLDTYHAGPEIYREYLIMEVLGYALADANKYIIGVDPDVFEIDITVLQDDEAFVFEDALERPDNNGDNQ